MHVILTSIKRSHSLQTEIMQRNAEWAMSLDTSVWICLLAIKHNLCLWLFPVWAHVSQLFLGWLMLFFPIKKCIFRETIYFIAPLSGWDEFIASLPFDPTGFWLSRNIVYMLEGCMYMYRVPLSVCGSQSKLHLKITAQYTEHWKCLFGDRDICDAHLHHFLV